MGKLKRCVSVFLPLFVLHQQSKEETAMVTLAQPRPPRRAIRLVHNAASIAASYLGREATTPFRSTVAGTLTAAVDMPPVEPPPNPVKRPRGRPQHDKRRRPEEKRNEKEIAEEIDVGDASRLRKRVSRFSPSRTKVAAKGCCSHRDGSTVPIVPAAANGLVTAGLLTKSSLPPPPTPSWSPPPPSWLSLFANLGLEGMAGTDAARAAVVMKEVRDTLTKELSVLQRLDKVCVRG